jgi:fucose permease
VTASTPRVAVLLLIYAAFVSMGLPDGILGAAWPAMRAELRVALNDNWPLLALGTCGSALSSFLSGLALRRFGVGRVLVLTTFLTACVIFGYSASATLPVIAGLSFFLGLGNGAIDAGLNHFAASKLSSRHMNWLHAFWGVGVSLGTLLLSTTFAVGGSWRSAYLGIALAQLGLAVAFTRNVRSLPGPALALPGEPRREHAGYLSTFKLPAAWASIASFFVYCGLECGAGLWIASVLHDARGWTAQAAGLMATLYWASLTAGRFLIGTVSQRIASRRIIRGGVLGALAGTSLIAVSSLLPPQANAAGLLIAGGLLLTGISLSPIFPMLMHDTPRSVGQRHATNLIGFQGASGQLGFTLVPILIGTLLRVYSPEWLGACLVILALALLCSIGVRERCSSQPEV